MQLVFVGTGYVGLVSGVCFAHLGINVTCVDVDAAKVERLRRGELPIYEPGLDRLVAEHVATGRLAFSTDLRAAAARADAIFIAVGTPSRRGDGHADLSYVEGAARDIGHALCGRDGYTVVVTKSTVPVGTGRRVEQILREVCPGGDFDVVSNPEFLREGSAVDDFLRPDRVVVGVRHERAAATMRALYAPLTEAGAPLLVTSVETAELTKYAANAFLAAKISFINEIADLCERCGADVQEVARGMGLDARIGAGCLSAGPGFGGSCFPKDTRALALTATAYGSPLRMVEGAVAVNEARKQAMAERVAAACGGSLAGARVAVFGVTFKANTDDMREAPSLTIIPALQAMGATVRAYDPMAGVEAAHLLPGVAWCADAYAAADGADVAVVLTEWDEFRRLDLDALRLRLARPRVVDLRNLFAGPEVRAAGLAYHGVGRAAAPVPAGAYAAAAAVPAAR